jgi:UDP-N-acetylmuramoylalanine--D-glutamate ligase
MLELAGKRVLVVGLGRSGVASALFLKAQGARVTVSDAKSEDQLRQEIPALLDQGITVETGGHGERTFQDQDLIVVSPGVPADAEPLVQARALGQPVIGEIELASQFFSGTIVAITGSNGKTTTTSLTGEVLACGGLDTAVGGNIGTPAISLVSASGPQTFMVLEVSSFQLETIRSFHPKLAVILNVTPDHLDRHRTFTAYIDAKARIFENQTDRDFALLNADDPSCVELAARARAPVYWFSRKRGLERGAFAIDGRIMYRSDGLDEDIMPVPEIPLKGSHNLENVLAAVLTGRLLGCAAEKIRSAVRAFKAVEHRLEYVRTIDGVDYYNDSKATNVDATIKALESFPAKIQLIQGGKYKGSEYRVLASLVQERVKCVYTIGVAAEKIESEIKSAAKIVASGTLERAVNQAAESARAGDIVLLAPACASFDQFENYEHRGRVFKELVAKLPSRS